MIIRKTLQFLSAAVCLALLLRGFACGEGSRYAGMSAEEITASLTLVQKASQMVQPACTDTGEAQVREEDFGSLFSQGAHLDAPAWREYIDGLQRSALASEAGIPFLYGQDDVHGVNFCRDTVIFPHNIGLGAANDEELMYQAGRITGEEALLCHMPWNFAPCVAQSGDPRWGRTYESYGTDPERIIRLSTAYIRGLNDSGAAACAKHFFGDGNTEMGSSGLLVSGVFSLLDRGNAVLSEEEIKSLLSVYQAQIDAGVQTIMISYSSLNGVRMHENQKYIQLLKNEMGFEGFIVSDRNGIRLNSPSTYYGQVVAAVNAGVDMLMEGESALRARDCIVSAVEKGDISEDRVNDAVRRIIRVKLDLGLFEDPLFENLKTGQSETGSPEYRQTAEKLVEKSLVLLKNENSILPLKQGTAVYIMGPAADSDRVQCGGWTTDWNGSPEKDISGVTSILEGFHLKEEEYGIRVLTDPSEAALADVVLLVVGERPYAEYNGDSADISLCGGLGLKGNKEAIEQAKQLGKPVIACIVAGRNVWISDWADSWDGIVMCYLPGSEGQGVANVLCGKAPFTGTLPSPWYASAEQIGTEEAWLPMGYGLTAGSSGSEGSPE